jgi:DNA-binding beta-propeller fold protein YncE
MAVVAALVVGVFGTTASGAVASTSQAAPVQYQAATNVSLPTGPLIAFELAAFNPYAHVMYVSEPDSQRIDVIDAKTGTARPPITGLAGPIGLVVTPDTHLLWVGDADANLKIIDPKTNQIVASVPSGGTGQIDTLAYDAKDHIMISQSHDETPPLLSLTSTKSRKTVKTLPLAAGSLIEQPTWDPASDRFYVNILTTPTNPGGEIDVVDPVKMSITTVYPTPGCSPLGSVVGPQHELYVACTTGAMIINDQNGAVITHLADVVGGAQVTYNPTSHQYIEPTRPATGGKLYIVDAKTRSVTQALPVPDGSGTRAVAVDPATNHIYVPEKNSGVQIFVPTTSH